jgi:hypothetical protein
MSEPLEDHQPFGSFSSAVMNSKNVIFLLASVFSTQLGMAQNIYSTATEASNLVNGILHENPNIAENCYALLGLTRQAGDISEDDVTICINAVDGYGKLLSADIFLKVFNGKMHDLRAANNTVNAILKENPGIAEKCYSALGKTREPQPISQRDVQICFDSVGGYGIIVDKEVKSEQGFLELLQSRSMFLKKWLGV